MSEITNYNPDVLTCLANLSNDEVFTPPVLANQMLDMLPNSIWSDKNATFLDPFSKSGVFLREITRRLNIGLTNVIPNQQERINHILTKQVFGIAITELTSLLVRRSVYCAKKANSKHSICTAFNTEDGNIRFQTTLHKWTQGKCVFCGASQEVYERPNIFEAYAYEFIHTTKPEDLLGNEMKFDVIIGNPPYQLSDGGDNSEDARSRGGATPLYNKFVQQAKKLNSKYLVMIIPSRWFAGGRGLDEFRDEMLNDRAIKNIVDYPVSSECFPGVEIKGGVCYFLREREYAGDCTIKTIRGEIVSTMSRPLIEDSCDIFIRFNEAIPIIRKVLKFNEKSFSNFVSTQKPFGFRTFYTGKAKEFDESVTLYANKSIGYVAKEDIEQNLPWVDKHKVYISSAYGAGEDFPHQIINKPFYGAKNTCCTETYLVIGPYEKKVEAQNAISYIQTKFFRFLVLLRKNTQHASKGVYQFVPVQDFSESWTDEKLYKKYKLTKEEIDFIESMVRPMEAINA